MTEGDILTKPYDKLEEKYYDMKATQGRRGAEKFEKEKLTSSKKEDKEEGGRQLLEALGTLSKGMGGQIAEGVGDSLEGFSKLFGVDIDEYKKSIE